MFCAGSAPLLVSSLGCKFHVGFGPAMRRDVEHEGTAMIGVSAFRIVRHALPGRRDEQAREILPDKSGTARLLRRDAQAAQMIALRIVDIDAATAPARIP